eukprot:gene365-6779_t
MKTKIHLVSNEFEDIKKVKDKLKDETNIFLSDDEFSITLNSIVVLIFNNTSLDNFYFIQNKVEYYKQNTIILINIISENNNLISKFEVENLKLKNSNILDILELKKENLNFLNQFNQCLKKMKELESFNLDINEEIFDYLKERTIEELKQEDDYNILNEDEEIEEMDEFFVVKLNDLNINDNKLKNEILNILGDNWRVLEEYKIEIREILNDIIKDYQNVDSFIELGILNILNLNFKDINFNELKQDLNLIINILLDESLPSNKIRNELKISKYSTAIYSDCLQTESILLIGKLFNLINQNELILNNIIISFYKIFNINQDWIKMNVFISYLKRCFEEYNWRYPKK